MIDHISLGVNDVPKSRAFYDKILEPLGYKRLFNDADVASGYGTDHPVFWIVWPLDEKAASAGNGTHVAFAAPSRAAVEEFYARALQTGGRDNGAPGLRPEYGKDYYGAFVCDLEGHRIEAVFRIGTR